MRQTTSSSSAASQNPFVQPAGSGYGQDAGQMPLSTVVYRSRAVKSLSAPELYELTSFAQKRNSREGITGLMLYDNERFFQWLEGPEDSVERVMGSITKDARHTDLEVLNKRPAEMRTFGAWSMKLAAPGQIMSGWHRDVIEPPREIVEDLHTRPAEAPTLLVKLVAVTAQMVASPVAEAVSQMPLHEKTAQVLKNVFIASVVPQLRRAGYSGTARAEEKAQARARELAELLIATDQAAALDLIQELQGEGAAIGGLAATLIEPAARVLGDMWGEDICSEFDVTLALCRLQTGVRLLGAVASQPLPGRLKKPLVLIAPEPGELHRLGAALDSSVLQDAGWSPHCEFPTDDDALQGLLASTWFDVLDLSLSAAFRREHTLPKITETIAEARRASRNPDLVVVVGGRVFREEKTAGRTVGADHASTTAHNVNRTILQTLSASSTRTLTTTEAPGLVATPA